MSRPGRSVIGKVARSLPGVGRVIRERDALEERLAAMEFPPGHFYSPIVDVPAVAARREEIFDRPASSRELPGIDLREEEQLILLRQAAALARPFPFSEFAGGPHRFFWNSGFYGPGDAMIYYGLLQLWRPRRLIEVGSGMTSCLALDTAELHLDGGLHCTFIDPYPERLENNLRPGDAGRVVIHRSIVQTLDADLFEALEADDILFIDSSHVAKTGSDVNYLLFQVLPRLKPGVHIHFHDLFYPFEYSWAHVERGLSWNEAYLLRAFLQFNTEFRIRLFPSFLQQFHGELMAELLPLSVQDRVCSFWLTRN